MPSFINISDNSGRNFCDVSSDFENLRISALRKASKISQSFDIVSASIIENNEYIENKLNNLNTTNKNVDKSTIIQSTSTRSGITFSIKKLLLENETQRREEVRQAIDKRKQQMEKSEKALQQEMALMREILVTKREREEAAELAKLEAEEEMLAQQSEIKKRHEQQLHIQRMQERKERLEREAEECRILKEREGIFQRIRNNLRERCKDVGMLSKSSKDKNSVLQMLGPYTMKLKELSQQMEIINEKARKEELTDCDVHLADQIARQSEEILNDCAAEIARIEALYEEETARREHEMKLAAANAQIENAILQQATQQLYPIDGQTLQQLHHDLEIIQPLDGLPGTPPNEIASNTPDNGTTTTTTTTDSSSVETVIYEQDHESYQIYQAAKQFLEQCTESQAFREFKESIATKKFRFECQKAINVPVNTISVINGSHLLDKYNKLRNLLSGRSSLNVNQYSQGPLFCKNLLARNIVSQGETLVSSKSEAAFGIAAVTLALMCDFPDFAELLKAHFYKTCPYLIPHFPSRFQGQSDEEYYKELGYKYIDGVVEKQTKFLTRISGIMRLYATIIVTNRRRGVACPHPLGLQIAWRWLAATINYEVQPKFADICATLILDMLEVVGNSLWTAYPRQCPKLLNLLRQHYYPQVQNCGGVSGGPVARLEKFLNDSIINNFIPPPEGQLPPNF
ncbi:hypothetical protein PV325_006171, partial [Microctonus aethiopoides]